MTESEESLEQSQKNYLIMRNFKGFVYFFQSGTQHSDGYFVECLFITGKMHYNMRMVN